DCAASAVHDRRSNESDVRDQDQSRDRGRVSSGRVRPGAGIFLGASPADKPTPAPGQNHAAKSGDQQPGRQPSPPPVPAPNHEQIASLPQREIKPVEGPPPDVEYREQLRTDVYQKLYALRKGKETPYAQIDELGRDLLERFSTPTEAGQVFYHLAHLHAQGGL